MLGYDAGVMIQIGPKVTMFGEATRCSMPVTSRVLAAMQSFISSINGLSARSLVYSVWRKLPLLALSGPKRRYGSWLSDNNFGAR